MEIGVPSLLDVSGISGARDFQDGI